MKYSTEDQIKLDSWRDKAKYGSLSIEEMKEAVVLLRKGRFSACFASKASREKLITEAWPTVQKMMEDIRGLK